jgi:hypothetical protein
MTGMNDNGGKIVPIRITAVMIFLSVVLHAGCSSVGPNTIDRDRFDYVKAISESWKRQTLINLLKARYMDAPVFMDVSSVINSYSMEREVNLGFSWEEASTQSLGGRGKYSDRPTITYTPLTGERFTRSLLRPIPISGILLLMQAGYPADYVLRICTKSINGINNRSSGMLVARDADAEFYELLLLFRRVQTMNGFEIRARVIDELAKVVMIIRQPESEGESGATNRLLHILGLEPDIGEYHVVFGNRPTRENEITILSRSMIQIMTEYASYIEVPESDVSEGRVYDVKSRDAEEEAEFPPLIAVHSGKSKPNDAFVAVEYRGYWFWIDDRDTYSKSTFSFLMMLFSSTEREAGGQTAPIITVPAG